MSDKLPETCVIMGQKATLFRKRCPPPEPHIWLLADGRFACVYGNQHKVFNTIKAAEKFRIGERPSLKLVNIGHGTKSEHDVLEVVEWEDQWMVDKESIRHRRGWSLWHLFDQAAIDAITALDKEHEEAEQKYTKRRQAIIAGMKRVSRREFKEILAQQEEEKANGVPDVQPHDAGSGVAGE